MHTEAASVGTWTEDLKIKPQHLKIPCTLNGKDSICFVLPTLDTYL